MVLAEALLRVPDDATADRLIEDQLATGDWSSPDIKSNALLVSASAWTLGITARIVHPGETPESILASLIRRLGVPVVRTATREAIRLLGSHFVLGQTIQQALRRARAAPGRYSFDMLGEGAAAPRTRRAISPPTRPRSPPSGRTPAIVPCRSGRASRSNCRRCIRASSRSRAPACSRSWCPM